MLPIALGVAWVVTCALVFVLAGVCLGWRAAPRFALAAMVQWAATVLGWALLLPFCLARSWRMSPWPSVKDKRQIDEWRWEPLNWIYGNPEDGVSGAQAIVWDNGVQEPYMVGAPAWWRAYCWSAWRNSADQLKYFFAWSEGPLYERDLGSLVFRIGWQLENGQRLPVLSL